MRLMQQCNASRAGVLACLAVVLALGGCGGVEGGNGQADPYNRGVYAPSSTPFGRSYGEWTALWWQWALSIPVSHSPLLDTTGADAGVGQSGPVWFLAGSLGDPASPERTFTVPAGKALLVPISNWIGAIPLDGATDAELDRTVVGYASHVTELEATVDGVPLKSLFSYRFKSPFFEYTMPTGDEAVGPPYEGTHRALSDGYWVMLEPLSAGPHEIRVRGKTVFPEAYPSVTVLVITSTYHLTAQ